MDQTDKRFLIIKLSSLGDVVHALAVLRTLRENHPRAFIAWMVEERYKDVLAKNPDLDEVIPVRLKHWRRNWTLESLKEFKEAVKHIRRRRFDTVIDLHGLIKSGVIALVSGAPNRLGFHPGDCKEKLSALFTNRKGRKMEPGNHVVDLYLNLIREIDSTTRLSRKFPLAVNTEAQRPVDVFLKAHPDLTSRPIVAVNPGAGFESKQWELSRFAEVADRLAAELELSILLIWGPGEETKAKQIGSRMAQPHWIAPKTDVLQSIALYRRLALMVSCDSGPLHLCAALGIPTVSIFGPTDPARNGAYGANHKTVTKRLACSFCWKRKCPLHTNACMDEVTVEDVFQAIRESVSKHVNIVAT